MSGTCGDYNGTVYLAHAWVPREHHADTTGPWHWWNVYKDIKPARAQAAERARGRGWGEYGKWDVTKVTTTTSTFLGSGSGIANEEVTLTEEAAALIDESIRNPEAPGRAKRKKAMNITVKVYADPGSAPDDKALWIDVDVHGWPVHPCDFAGRILELVNALGHGRYREHLATVNGDALSALGFLVRTKQISLPIQAIIVHKDGSESIPNPMATDGMFVYPWAERPEDCQVYTVLNAGFNYRFHP